MLKKIIKLITFLSTILGAISAILAIFIYFSPSEKASAETVYNNGDNSIVVNGNIDKIDNSKNVYYQLANIKVTELYTQIIEDYYKTSKSRILQDFGEPTIRYYPVEGTIIGPGILSEELECLSYSFKNGEMIFYIQKNSEYVQAIEVHSKSNIEVYPLDKKEGNHLRIILGKTKFKDLYKKFKIKNAGTNIGSMPGVTHSFVEFYAGRFGDYRTYRFGIDGHGFYGLENGQNNNLLLEKIKDNIVDYVIIQ